MLSLTIGRESFKICHKEGARTTVWDVSKNDSEEEIVKTFKDVIAFVEGAAYDQRLTAPMSEAAAHALRERLDGGDVAHRAAPTNGWAAYAAPEIPEHLKGEVELIHPGEDA